MTNVSSEIESLYNLGMKYNNEENISATIDCFRQILDNKELSPDSKHYRDARHILACRLYEMGRIKEGLKLFQDSAAANYPDSLYYLGTHYEKQNHIKFISCYVKAAKLGHQEAINTIHNLEMEILLTDPNIFY